MILDQTLEKIGLNSKEAKVYLATLELGQAKVLEIAKKTEIKRPTVYLILDDLKKKGLVSEVPKGTKTIFIAENPEKLINELKSREEALKKVMPMLKTIYNIDKHKPQVKFYEGKEGIKQVYNEIHKAKTYIDFYGSIKGIKQEFPESFLKYDEIKKMKIPVREIISDDPADKAYAHEIKKFGNPKHIVKIMPKKMQTMIDSAIFDNKIAIISIKKDYFGVLIESEEIAQSYRMLYELAWQSAHRFK
jgi:sugar-specific transcriptional regulator TrmB